MGGKSERYLQPISHGSSAHHDQHTLSTADIVGAQSNTLRNWFANKLAVGHSRRRNLRYQVVEDALGALGVPPNEITLFEALKGAAIRETEPPSAPLGASSITVSSSVSSAEIESRVQLVAEYSNMGVVHHEPGGTGDIFPTEAYQYEHLETSKPIIRVLRVEPGKKLDPAILPPPYESVSYAWGDGVRDMPIICDGKILRITKSLHSALCRIRLTNASRCVWADATCINQDDKKERGYQVSQMLNIYQKASQTLVWLGKDPQMDAISAFSLICVLVNTHKLDSHTADFSIDGKDIETNGKGLLSISSWKQVFDSLATMYMLPWFWRLWVVQEIVMSRSATIMWGEAQISWRLIGLASEWLRTNEHHLLRYFGISGIYNAYLMEYLARRDDTSSFSILRLLGLTRQFGATDPRDRIFALLGIPSADSGLGNGSLLLQPDYRMATHDLYRKFARLILQRDKSLHILSAVQHGAQIEESLPSWVPSWNTVYCHGLAPSEPGPNHRASDDLQMQEIQADNFNHLILKGIPFSTIVKCMETFSPQSFGSHLRRSLNVYAFTRAIKEFWGDCWDETRATPLCWTLTAGKDWYGMLVSNVESHWADFAAYWSEFSLPSNLDNPHRQKHMESIRRFHKIAREGNGDNERFLEAASNACVGRRLFVTEDGTLGLGPGAVQVGDRCCILFGGIVPFVLRQRMDGTHALVGECYIQDVMQGEIVQEWREGRAYVKEFCIC